jgi:hypothetical protein
LSVQALDGRRRRNTRGQRGGAELGGAAAGREDAADGDVFDQRGVDVGAREEAGEGGVEEVGAGCVFERAAAAFCEGGADGAGYDDLWRGREVRMVGGGV